MDHNTASLMAEWVPDYATNGSSSFGSYQSTGTDDHATLNQLPDRRGGGLGDRIAARAGFNAPRINTKSEVTSIDEVKLPYITIPPGISPTALLESPVFLSNSLLQTQAMVSVELSKEDFFDEVDAETFAFKPHPEQGFPIAGGGETRCIDTISCTAEHSPPLNDQQEDDEGEEQQAAEDSIGGGGDVAGIEDDGYNWRKYGQKQVKGSEFPRSYFKCTHLTCPVKKKVERSREGHLTEIIYTGEHNHPKPVLNRRPSSCFNQFDDSNGVDNGFGAGQNGHHHHHHHHWSNDSFDTNSLLITTNSELRKSSPPIQSGEGVDPSSTFSTDEEDVSVTVRSASIANDIEGDEPESKRRRIETCGAEIGSGATRAIREPRVVVQTASDVDILDDGYRWRKYGQKVVKGNPNPRSYYKCTSVGCTVRKHVERASNDLKSVITTYEGKHNHDVPPARNSSHVNSSNSAGGAFGSQTQSFIQRSEPSQVNNMTRYERASSHLNSYIMPMMQQHQMPFIPTLHMAGFGPMQSIQPYQMQQRQGTDMGHAMTKGEAKVEHNSDHNFYLSNGSSVHHQVMNRMPLGP